MSSYLTVGWTKEAIGRHQAVTNENESVVVVVTQKKFYHVYKIHVSVH